MREILDHLPVGLIILSKDGSVEYANRFCIENALVSRNYEGKKYYEAIRNFGLIGAIREFLDGKSHKAQFEHESKSFRATLISDGTLIIEDISKEVSLKRIQKEFIATVSHELSTPLTAVKGLLETALFQETPGRELLEKALKRLGDLEKLINSLRFLVILGSGEKPRKERFSLKNLIEEILGDLKEEIIQKKLKVELYTGDAEVESDREKLYILLKNLLENAVKYNRAGGKVSVSVEPSEDRIKILVQDTGEGIPEEEIPLIFQPFFGGKNRKGMGLGLAISKRIADFLGTDLTIKSERGKGTTAEISLP